MSKNDGAVKRELLFSKIKGDKAITYDGGQTSGTVPDFNEYVWIPITDNSKFARVAWNGHKKNILKIFIM